MPHTIWTMTRKTAAGRGIKGGVLTLTFLLCLLSSGALLRGNDGYFTTYNHHVEKGELELMIMSDFTVPSSANRNGGQNNYFSQMLELEYGVTDKYASELMIEAFQDVGGTVRFTGFRWENRYSFFKENKWLNPVVYMEYEHLDYATRYKMEVSGWVRPPYEEEESSEPEKDERILETRLILSHDFASTNVAFNWINETDLRGGLTDFGYSIGLMHKLGASHHHAEGPDHESGGAHAEHRGAGLAAVGVELIGALGDSRRLALRPRDQQHYLQPMVMFHLGKGWMLHTGAAVGLTPSSDRLLLRMALGFGL
ncbi:MAG: hypothetical protein HYX75_20105 [Acidobacteria bacterium]|nr:hypothetical protein [Acidobacteriota bacterium]